MKKTIYINPSYARENKPILDHIEHNQNFVISPIEVLHDIKSSIDHLIIPSLIHLSSSMLDAMNQAESFSSVEILDIGLHYPSSIWGEVKGAIISIEGA